MKEQKGITLIALIITIIVMLILVAVTVNTVIQSGLLNQTKDAGDKYEKAVNDESKIDDSSFTIKTDDGNKTLNLSSYSE